MPPWPVPPWAASFAGRWSGRWPKPGGCNWGLAKWAAGRSRRIAGGPWNLSGSSWLPMGSWNFWGVARGWPPLPSGRSALILRRIGLESLCADGVALPPYFDPRYGCQMEVLRFDSRFPNPRYRDWVAEFISSLTSAPVMCRERARSRARAVPRGIELPLPNPALLPSLVPSAWMAWQQPLERQTP